MFPALEKIRHSLARDRDLALAVRASKGVRYLIASGSARLLLWPCDRVGPRGRTLGRPRIINQGRLTIGSDVVLNSTFAPVELIAHPGAVLEIGDRVAMNYGTAISARGRVRLGDRVSLGPYCIVADSEGADERAGGIATAAIDIENDVWLAGRVTVLPGAHIGAGSVVTAGSVVVGRIPPGVVAGGNPARTLRGVSPASEAVPSPGPAPAVTTDAEAVSHSTRPPEHRGTLFADFTANDLAQALAELSDRPGLAAELAPLGQVAQALLSPTPAANNATDFAVVWTRPEAAIAGYARLVVGQGVSRAELLDEVDAFCDLVISGAERFRFTLVPSWTRPAWQRGLGIQDARAEQGLTRALAAMNERLMERLAARPTIYVLDAQRWVSSAGSSAYSEKLWYLGKVPFGAQVFKEAALEIQAALRAFTGEARKLLVVDLDDTLWGGTVGELGWEQLRLGGHDSVGEALVDFQRGLKALTERGVVLGIVSKNEEAVALEALRRHPEMVLKPDDFAGWRINWNDKARNLVDLAAELNLGLQSVVFLDDSPVERARVREALPEVLVPEWPEDKLHYPSALASLACFDTATLSKEDAGRTRLYVADRQREQLKRDVGSLDLWLKGLNIKVRVEPLGPANLKRTVQLLNKTNQMNLSTRRLAEPELVAWMQRPRAQFWTFTVQDRIGDAGLTGLLSMEGDDGVARIVDFVLSCRVMGRRIEEAMLHVAVASARKDGARRIEARFVPTPKNKPCLEFWLRSGFDAQPEQRFVWQTQKEYPVPEPVTLEGAWIH